MSQSQVQNPKSRVSRWLLVVGSVVLVLALALPALAQGVHSLPRSVMGNGGASFLGAGNYQLSGTLGQPVAGPAAAPAGAGLRSGFWYGAGVYRIYLPIVVRSSS